MALSAGTCLGPHEIVSPIGAGGMGEVYKARDTRLDRSVAIKILTAEFAQNAQLKLRFEREAKTISQLNHPHICTLDDLGEENGTSFLVMELVDGESLADSIARGYHSFVSDGPLFSSRVPFEKGDVVERAPFAFCELLAAG
jgi:eukaryotic-like serine/threonine-protein kinase